jgi:hypothetical protein
MGQLRLPVIVSIARDGLDCRTNLQQFWVRRVHSNSIFFGEYHIVILMGDLSKKYARKAFGKMDAAKGA